MERMVQLGCRTWLAELLSTAEFSAYFGEGVCQTLKLIPYVWPVSSSSDLSQLVSDGKARAGNQPAMLQPLKPAQARSESPPAGGRARGSPRALQDF